MEATMESDDAVLDGGNQYLPPCDHEPLSPEEKRGRLADRSWWVDIALWVKGERRVMRPDVRQLHTSMGSGPGSPEERAVKQIRADVEWLLRWKDQTLYECSLVYDVFRYYVEHHPALGEDDWFELAALKCRMTRGQVETAVRVTVMHGLIRG